MATFACPPERSAMGVILAVTGIAIRGQGDLRDIFGDVTGVAIDAAVRSRQRVARLRVMIEAPPCPAVRIVAAPTDRSQAAFMMLVAMAGDASQRRALELQRAMAFLARHHSMTPDQRKSGDVMIEGLYLTPVGLAVTLLAAGAKLPLVPIVLAVTGHAGRRQLVAIEIAGVARIALNLRVRGP